MLNLNLPVSAVGPLLLFLAGFVAYFALFAAVLHFLAMRRRTLARSLGLFLLGTSLGLLLGAAAILISR